MIFTEVGTGVTASLVNTLSTKVSEALYRTLTVEQVNEIKLSFHVFPEDWDDHCPSARSIRVSMWISRRVFIAGQLPSTQSA